MPNYYYEGISREGEKIKGLIFADDEIDLRVKLRTEKIRPTKIKIKEMVNEKKQKRNFTISKDERLFFIKEILVMLKAGLTIQQALEVISLEGITDDIKELASSVRNHVESGTTLAQALARYPKYFDNLLLNLIAAGELRGNLDVVLNRWIEYSKTEQEIETSVKKTITYPIVIAGIIFLAFITIVIGIAPVFVHIYRTNTQALPLSLAIFVTISNILKANMFYILIALLSLSVTLYFLFKNKLINLSLSGFALKAPIFSKLFKEVYNLKTILVLNCCLKSGISLNRSLELAAEKIGNHIFSEHILEAKEANSKNEPIAPFFARKNFLKPMVVQVISVGETMGNIDEMLPDLIEYLREEVSKLSSFFASIIEPLILIIGGLVIGSVLTSFFIPILTLLNK